MHINKFDLGGSTLEIRWDSSASLCCGSSTIVGGLADTPFELIPPVTVRDGPRASAMNGIDYEQH